MPSDTRAAHCAMCVSDDRSLKQVIAQVASNMNEGALSTRGEGWFIAQACLVLGVLAAPAEPVAPGRGAHAVAEADGEQRAEDEKRAEERCQVRRTQDSLAGRRTARYWRCELVQTI